MALTEKETNLVIEILMDRLLEYKADNDEQEYEEEIEILTSAIDSLDQLAIEWGYDD
jgi:hypothetical protein